MEIKLTFQELSTKVTYISHHYTTIHEQKRPHRFLTLVLILFLQTCVILYI
jgi:hypothetical protein